MVKLETTFRVHLYCSICRKELEVSKQVYPIGIDLEIEVIPCECQKKVDSKNDIYENIPPIKIYKKVKEFPNE